MKAGMKLAALAALAVVPLAAGSAIAGLQVPYTQMLVQVTPTTAPTDAVGGTGAAYLTSSTDPEFIGCAVVANPANTADPLSITCFATDSSSNAASCSISDDYNALAAVATMTPDSELEFKVDSSGTCTMIKVTTDSSYPPKVQNESE
jgi:hypothetical protein